MKNKKIYVIAGSTASGKSALAVQMAHKLNGSVVNADSIQVYRDIPLLTARPNEQEQQGIPHYLYGFLDDQAVYSVAKWLKDVQPILESVQTPVIVGGTGLYLKALIQGVNDIPQIDPDIRHMVRLMPLEEVKAKLPEISFSDPQRLRRALEVYLSTGKSLKWFQEQPKRLVIQADFETIWLNLPREEIHQRCDQRFRQMIEAGAIDQVAALQKLNPTGGVTKAIGYKEIGAYLSGQITQEEMIHLAVIATRQYAKRQTTWFKHQLKWDKILNNLLETKEYLSDL